MPSAPDDYVLQQTADLKWIVNITPRTTTNDIYAAFGYTTHTAAQKAIDQNNLRGVAVGTRPHP